MKRNGSTFSFFLLFLLSGFLFHQNSEGQKNSAVILATTTSVQDTGLLDIFVERFNDKGEYVVKPVAVGSGQALQLGKQGEADILLVHSPEDEAKFVQDGFGIQRTFLMYNEFILVGPPNDPARVKGTSDIAEAFKKACAGSYLFVSRGDNSGTHKKELSIWKTAGITPSRKNYLEAGQGMGPTLRIADEKRGYCLVDRATYLTLQKSLNLIVVSEGDVRLKNIYSLILVNPRISSKINVPGARAFYDFLLSPEMKDLIAHYKKETYGRQLFFTESGK